MRKLILALALLLLLPAVGQCNQAWHDWCWNGNAQVITSGLYSSTLVQGSSPQCVVSVFIHGGGVATIYADNNNTPLANPFVGGTNGQFLWYAANGRYDETITVTINGTRTSLTISDILLCDPAVPASACGGGSSPPTGHNLLSTTHLDTIPYSPPVRGDLVTAQAQTSPSGVNPAWARLPLGTTLQYLQSNGTDAQWAYSVGFYLSGTFVSTRSQLNVIPGTNVTATLVDDSADNRVNLTVNASPGSAACILPGTNTGVLSEHPIGTCYDSANYTWDDGSGKQNMQAGLTNTVGTADTFIFGISNVLTGLSGGAAIGDSNTLAAAGTGGGVYALGQGNTVKSKTTFTFNGAVAIGIDNTVGDGTGTILDGYALGDSNTIYNSQQTVALNYENCVGKSGAAGSQQYVVVSGFDNQINGCGSSPGTGTANDVGVYGDLNGVNAAHSGSSGTASPVFIVGYTNQVDTNLGNVGGAYIYGLDNIIDAAAGDVVIVGSSNTANSSTNASGIGSEDSFIGGFLNTVTSSGNFVAVGGGNTLSSCSACGAVGFLLTNSTNNSIMFGYGASGLTATANGGVLNNIVANSSTGTTTNTLTKLVTSSGASKAVKAATTDSSGIVGVTVSGAGTSGNAVIASNGIASCVFDGATTAGDYVQISTSTAGDCHDTGAATYPTAGQVIGRVLSTNGSGGTYTLNLFAAELQGNAGSSGVTDGAGTTTANELAVSTSSAHVIGYKDLPDVRIIPAANCAAGTAGNGWSTASSNFTATCRAGTNNLGGAQDAVPNTGASAQFMVELPDDWDTSTQPYINIYYGSGANTSGTVIWTVSTACSDVSTPGGTSDDPSFNAESAFSTQTMANANRMWYIGGQFTHVTSGNGCKALSTMIVKVAVSGTATSNINAYQAVMTFPRQPMVQAN